MDPGDFVYVVFWRSLRDERNPAAGTWEFVTGTVVSVGKKVCYELHAGSSAAPWLGGDLGVEAPPGSALRFVDPARVFLEREAAVEATKTLPPPAVQ